MITRPDLIFADEPSGNLDTRSGQQLLEFLRRAVEEFTQTIVMVTHDANAASYADRVVFLSDGRVVDEMSEPTAERVLDRVKSLDS
jgi:putative ABC transport system ATP-binding protein